VQKLLVANRGEIAIRILRAANELGIRTVVFHSHEDRFAVPRFKADEAYRLGEPGEPYRAYLDKHAIVAKAKSLGIDAVHPGYGFLSEDAEFATLCRSHGITFIGPASDTLRMFGDKVEARVAAQKAGLRVIPGTDTPVPNSATAIKIAAQFGYPVVLKAVAGGGGKGIRVVQNDKELVDAFDRARSEAQTSFGRADIYIEKKIESAKHIEVQILGDSHGNCVHLFERDCSIQRRHQKIIEIAPAPVLPETTRQELFTGAVALAKAVQYVGLATVEYLVDKAGHAYFLEVNPRVQVEHTVTEVITGIDLVQASILVADGAALSDERIGIDSQDSVTKRGFAIQCRVTTEDPTRNFAPDTGTIIAYRPAAGFGIRLDEGHGTSGGVVTPHYDSLLVKITAHGRSLALAAAKMHRSLAEFRIRGVKHNIPLLRTVMRHDSFLQGEFDVGYFENNPEIFRFVQPRDRATRILRYIADATVNDPHGLGPQRERAYVVDPKISVDEFTSAPLAGPSFRDTFRKEGVKGLVARIRNERQLLLTDTTMRDAHQSLFATRLRTRDILAVAPFYEAHAKALFSVEVWGGATFDTALRFLHEDPWERLASIREKVPSILTQMLLRGDNAVGYTNYPSWVIRDFITESVNAGLDVFRIFDCLNQPDKMQTAVDQVRKQGAIAEVCVCYTGNLTPGSKYDLKYFTTLAKELQRRGADILCIKDMAGLLRPAQAATLIKALKESVDLPIHLHTHDTSGAGVAMLLEAAKAGCDIVDGAVSSMSGTTSQPSLNALVASLAGQERETPIQLEALDRISRYFEVVRTMYSDFDPGVLTTSTTVYKHEIPGGQYSNLYDQARKVGVSADEFHALTERYREVNEVFGDIVKVTPSSKVVGDMALLLQKHNLTGPEWLAKKPKLDYPDSVVSFFKGHMGMPYGGFPPAVRELVLGVGAGPPAPEPIGNTDSQADVAAALKQKYGREFSKREVLSSRLYPKVFSEYMDHLQTYGDVENLPTSVFFHGLKEGVEVEVDIEPGKTLVVSLHGISKASLEGKRTVFFNLNGFPREIEVRDNAVTRQGQTRKRADSKNPLHIGAAMPGKLLALKVKVGDVVDEGQVLLVTEAMKMEYAIAAKVKGTIAELPLAVGAVVAEGDLLVELK
jgi:pyruvate carboxylase